MFLFFVYLTEVNDERKLFRTLILGYCLSSAIKYNLNSATPYPQYIHVMISTQFIVLSASCARRKIPEGGILKKNWFLCFVWCFGCLFLPDFHWCYGLFLNNTYTRWKWLWSWSVFKDVCFSSHSRLLVYTFLTSPFIKKSGRNITGGTKNR